MKFKSFFIVGILLLTIITIGAVSASENLTASDFSEDSVLESSVEEIELSAGDEDVIVGDQELSDDDITVDAPSEVKACENCEITVNLPESATGYITKYIDDEEYGESNIYEGVSYIDFSFYTYGNHTIDLLYSGGDVFDERIIWTQTYCIDDYVVDVSDEYYMDFGESGTIYVSLPYDAEGNLTLDINGKTYEIETWGGGSSFEVSDLKLGENPFTVTFSGDKTYYSKSAKGSVIVSPKISVPYDMRYNQEAIVSLNLPSDAKGNLIVIFDEKRYSSKLVKGKASIELPTNMDKLGYYEFEAYYDGSDYEVPEEQDIFLFLAPNIEIPKYVWVEDEVNIIFEVSQSSRGILNIQVNDEDYKEIQISNAKTVIPLTNLDIGESEIGFYYIDGSYEFWTSSIICVIEESPNIDLNISVADEIRHGEYLYASVNLPEYFEGTVLAYLDGELYGESSSIYMDNTSSLSLGRHTLKFITKNDSYYKDAMKTVTFDVVDVLMYLEDDTLFVDITKDVTGNITVFIDGKQYKNMPITPAYYGDDEYGYSYVFNLNLNYGHHKIMVKYSGDKSHKAITKSFDILKEFEIGFSEDTYIYGSDELVSVNLPDDSTNDITVKIDGKAFNNVVYSTEEWYAGTVRNIGLNVSSLGFGCHDVEIFYPGDEVYPSATCHGELEIKGEINVDYGVFNRENTYIALKLPANAKGKLVITLDKKTSKYSLTNGFRNVSLGNLGVGEHDIFAYYDGNDYEVEELDQTLNINPYYDYKYYSLNEDGYVYLEFPSDAKGNVIVYMDDDVYKTSRLTNGKANITLSPKIGYHKFDICYDSSDYEFFDSFQSYLVFYDFEGNNPLYKGESISINVSGVNKFTAIINGVKYTPKIVNGKVNFTPTNYVFKWNNCTFICDGDLGHFEDEFSFWIKPKVNVGHDHNYIQAPLEPWAGATPRNNINVSASDYMTIDLENKFNGKYVVVIDNDYYTEGNFVNGFANISLSKVKLGLQEIYVDYEYEKGKHDFVNFFANIKKAPEISVTANNVYDGQKVKITVNAAKDISDNVVVTVNNKNYTVKMSKGKGSLEVPNLVVGNYPISVKYLGDKNFAGDSVKSSVNVLSKLNPNMIVSTHDIMKGDLEIIKISADKSISGSVLVNINNNNYTVELTEGQGSLNVSGLNPDTYAVKAIFKGNTKFISQSVKATFKVTHIPKITAKAVSVLYTAKGKYSVTVYGTDGKVARGVNVVFKIAGKKIKTVKTNSRGVATFTVTKAPGTYKVSATALGKTVTKKLTVKHVVTLKKVTPKKSAKKLVLTATLKKVNGKYLKNKQITFKFNGKKYVGKTNKKGVAKVTIKKSVLKKLKVGKKITYQATYLKDIVKQSVKVKK